MTISFRTLILGHGEQRDDKGGGGEKTREARDVGSKGKNQTPGPKVIKLFTSVNNEFSE